jgi:CheY-like chemotaxis protein
MTTSLGGRLGEELAGDDGRVVVMEVASYIDEAMARLERQKPPFDGLVVDLMLPRTKADRDSLERLETERSGLVDRLYLAANMSLEERAHLTAKVTQLDRLIERVVASEGGCDVLEWFARSVDPDDEPEKPPRPLRLPVVFMTARGLPEVMTRCQSLVEDRWRRIFEKPVDEAEVIHSLLDLLAATD